MAKDALSYFHPAVRSWFVEQFGKPTLAQELAWPVIEQGHHSLVLAPTGSGKTLAAFLSAINHVMFTPLPEKHSRCRVLYISPLKALAADIERNLREPLAGIAMAALRRGEDHVSPAIAVRTGDTPAAERARFSRSPTDILITTPESLYLLLTSKAREVLRSVRWVIIDEIHAMVSTKRGSHLAVSLERLQWIAKQSFQRIGLSATQRPLEEVAQFLGGGDVAEDGRWMPRPVKIVNAGGSKDLDLTVAVPIEDMSNVALSAERASQSAKNKTGSSTYSANKRSIWPSMYPYVLDLIRKHRTTLIFVNNRRLAERMAAALNELAGETLVRAHHGSVAREQRVSIEEQMKKGVLPAIVATSSLELGIDMGSIDLVIQVESPSSVAGGLQRVGRAGHRANVSSKGILLPKFRGDLVACAAITTLMIQGRVEEMRYIRNPLDVLAQQIVGMLSMDSWMIADLEKVIRRSAPFAQLTHTSLENVLDLLAGRYPSEEFHELRPRIVWNRVSGKLRAREGARAVAIANAGTIPDRGLYGVFLSGAAKGQSRVGELDEEMVFETKPGDVFLLGTTSWRVQEIKHDRVIVTPAPGEPGLMPFWHGESTGRALEFGRHIGALVRTLQALPPLEAQRHLRTGHRLDEFAARNLLAYLQEQREKAGAVPDDRTIVVERYVDELGDWRVCLLSPFGGRVHAPWTHAIEATILARFGLRVETLWSDDGIVVRFPEADEPPSNEVLLPDPDEVESLIVKQMGASALFAARFREAAGRALLLPRRFPGQRKALWQQRRKASDLLQITSRYPTFPIILETYRELLQDVFDMPGLIQILREIHNRAIRVVTVQTKTPSPFAASLMFGYVGNFMYEGDAPLAERRAQALAIDPSQLRELLGEAELRDLLDPEVMRTLEAQLQHLDPARHITGSDGLHDLLLRIGDLNRDEIASRCSVTTNTVDEWLRLLKKEGRVITIQVAKQRRWIAIEDAARYRDALGVALPSGVPEPFLERVQDPFGDLMARFARTHSPFSPEEGADRFGLAEDVVESHLARLAAFGRLVQGAFRRGKTGAEWCDPELLRRIRQKSLARIRQEVEPVDQAAYGRFLPEWHGMKNPGRGTQGILDALTQLQGYPVPASVLESEILPARIKDYDPRDLDQIMASGFVVWTGVEPIGQYDGRIVLYLTENAAKLAPRPAPRKDESELHQKVKDFLKTHGASFFPQILAGLGGGFKREISEALWDLVWNGEATNDTMHSLRVFLNSKARSRRRSEPSQNRVYFSMPAEVTGRWSLMEQVIGEFATATEHLTAMSFQMLERNGVITREAFRVESAQGGFSGLYPVLKALEEAGKIQRGYFIAGCGAAQFASAGALNRLRSFRESSGSPSAMILAATDPANPYGATLPWPVREDNRLAGRVAGAMVVLFNGELAAFFGRSEKMLLTFFKSDDSERTRLAHGVAKALASLVDAGRRRAVFITEIDGMRPEHSILADALSQEGFVRYSQGWQLTTKSQRTQKE